MVLTGGDDAGIDGVIVLSSVSWDMAVVIAAIGWAEVTLRDTTLEVLGPGWSATSAKIRARLGRGIPGA
jgi:hypothetical protein